MKNMIIHTSLLLLVIGNGCSEQSTTPVDPLLPPLPSVTVSGTASLPFWVGYTGASDSGNYAAVLYGVDGNPLNAYAFGKRVVDVQQQPDGNLTMMISEGDRDGHFIELDSGGEVLREIRGKSTGETGVHELRLYPDGSQLLYTIERPILDMTSYDGFSSSEVKHCIVEYIRPDGTFFSWKTRDGMEYTDSYDHYQVAQPNPFHVNAIDRDTDGHLLISMRNASQIVKVNSITGDVIWRLGGKRSDFTFENDPLNGFTRQHGIRRLANGNVILFDNGNDHTPQVSRAIEYHLDETNMTARLVWEYRDTIFASAMGFANRLPNGNTLICYGTARIIQEVTPSGDVIFKMQVISDEMSYRAIGVE